MSAETRILEAYTGRGRRHQLAQQDRLVPAARDYGAQMGASAQSVETKPTSQRSGSDAQLDFEAVR
jgi:hypothetical protein